MNDPLPATHTASLTLGDIYYALFRNKWKVILCTLAGIGAAAAVYKFNPPPYQSEAKLFIRYVSEGKTLAPPGEDARMKTPDQRGETIINSEIEILTSLDLSKQIADTVGPEKILANVSGPKDRDRAAGYILRRLSVDVPAKSSVIHIAFKDSDPNIVQPVLAALIQSYLKMHVEVHESVGIVGDFLSQETDQLRARLAQTEDELKKARDKAGVISLDDAKKAVTDQMARLRQEIFEAQAELAERSSALQEYAKLEPGAATEVPASSGQAASAAQVADYQGVLGRVDLLRRREQELLTLFTPENARVKEIRDQLTQAEGQQKQLETQFPQLSLHAAPVTGGARSQSGSFDPIAETTRIAALRSKIKVLTSQLEQVRAEAASLDTMDVSMQDLKRRKELQEANYRYYAASLEQSHIDEALGAGRVSNISQIQTPSPPFRDWTKIYKVMAGLAGGGLALGLGWAFAIELYFDRSIRRPVDIERALRVPFFLSIPDVSRNGYRRLANAAAKDQLLLGAGSGGPSPLAPALTRAAAADATLQPFYETLRDRLIGYFENKGLTHKPKLVAVTGLRQNSGVTTIASGLAGCFSKTGEGNVLLVDMTGSQGSAQQYFKGNAVQGLDELLEGRKDASPVEENLYVVAESPNSDKLTRALPQRFTKLVPKLKASDFDYIIFDMPPVSQISVTPRLASFMDMVLLVVESEKTDREVVQRATALLEQSKAHVGAVLNKTRAYVPQKLHQEFLNDL